MELENGIISVDDVAVDDSNTNENKPQILSTSGIILNIYSLIVDGDSSLYVILDEEEEGLHYYWINLTENYNVQALNFEVGDMMRVSYELTDDDSVRRVVGILQ